MRLIMNRLRYICTSKTQEKGIVAAICGSCGSTLVARRILLALVAVPVFVLAIFLGTVISAIFFGGVEL